MPIERVSSNRSICNKLLSKSHIKKVGFEPFFFWPASRLVDTWNSFAGVAPFDDLKPVKKFASRKAAKRGLGRLASKMTPAPEATTARRGTTETEGHKGLAKGKQGHAARRTAKAAKQSDSDGLREGYQRR
jgi:hypothetical protein